MARTYSIAKLFRTSALATTFAVSAAIAAIVIITQYLEFQRNSATYKQEFIEQQKDILRSEMGHAFDLIQYERDSILDTLKIDIRQRTVEAHSIAESLYTKNINALPETVIKKLILDALTPIRFYDGRGYFWIHDFNHTLIMNPFRPDMIGKNDFNLTDLAGKKIVQSFVNIGVTSGEGFDMYYWNKPGQHILLPKISYLKLFAPYGWILGAGDYLDDAEIRAQESIKRRLSLFRSAESCSLRIMDFNGTVLFDPTGVYPVGTNILEARDAEGRFIVQHILAEGLKAEGGFGTAALPQADGTSPASSLFFARTVLGWGWIVVASVPLERMNQVVFEHLDSLRTTMIRQVALILSALALSAAAVFMLASRVSGRLDEEFTVFISFFKDVARQGAPINSARLRFSEFKALAESANMMSKDLSASRHEILTKTLQLEEEVETRKQAETEVLHARNAFQGILDSMPSMIIGVNDDTRITHWNCTAEEATGIEAEKVKGAPLAETFPAMASHMEAVWEALREGVPVIRNRQPFVLKDHPRQVDMLVYPLASDGARGAVIRLDDVTERQRMEEVMIQTEKMMSVGGLAAGMAHEINNPLSGILQSAQVIVRRVSGETAASREAAAQAGCSLESVRLFLEKREIPGMVEGIRLSAERASKIVSDMLEFSRKTDSTPQPTSIPELLDKAVDLCSKDYDLKKNYDFKQIEIVKEYAARLAPVPCSPMQIEQVLMNILRNAAQAMAQNPGGKPPRIVLRTRQEKETACIEIEDNGPGMDEATRRRVFEPFYSTKQPGEGTGLGLSVSFFIITDIHGGTIHVESEPGKGARFVIRLPMVYTHEVH